MKKGKHQIVVDNQPVAIFLEPNDNAVENTRMSSLTQSRKGARPGEKHPNEKDISSAVDSCVQKVSIEGARYVPAANSPVQGPFAEDLL